MDTLENQNEDGERAIVTEEEVANEQRFTFFNKKYRRFRVGRFEFKNSYLVLNADEREEFLGIMNDRLFPKREALQIVEVDEAARAQSEKSVLGNQASTAVRGTTQASDILTGKDQNRALPGASSTPAGGANLNPNPSQAKPAFDLSRLR